MLLQRTTKVGIRSCFDATIPYTNDNAVVSFFSPHPHLQTNEREEFVCNAKIQLFPKCIIMKV